MSKRSLESAEQSYEEYIQELRETIRARGWKDSTESLTREIQFIADLAKEGHLSPNEIQEYAHSTKITTDILIELKDGPYVDERRNLIAVVQEFNETLRSRFNEELLGLSASSERKAWSLSGSKNAIFLYWDRQPASGTCFKSEITFFQCFVI